VRKRFLLFSPLLLGLVAGPGYAQAPVPFINQPLVPDAMAPGGSGFTMTVNGNGFVPASVVNWNGNALATSFVSELQLTAAVPATDIAVASTASITVVNPAPGGGASNVVFFPITHATSSVAFSTRDFETAPGPETVATGDFNGDGKLDLAVGVYGSSKVSILLGNGDGTFQAHMDYATGALPSSVVARDFNGDGKLDLAVLNQSSGTISIFLGKGDGTFQPAVEFAVVPGLGRMIAADFNGDGKLDLAATNADGDIVSILLGNGDGTFRAHVDYATGSVPFPIAVGDLNGDGKLDLVVGNAHANTFSVLLGNGDGTFQTHVDYPTIPNPQSLVLADFNGDGKLDLAVFSEGDGTSILLGNGDGTFRHLADYATGCGSNGTDCTAAVGDLNGDGKLDLAVRNSPANTVSVFLGNGDGTFQPPLSFPTCPNPNQVAIGDFNGDGRLDLVAADLGTTDVTVLLQTTGVAVSLTPDSLMFAPQAVGTFSAARQATLKNVGDAAVKITNMGRSGDFYGTQNCPGSLLPGASCAIKVTFTPTSAGSRSGDVSIGDNAPGSPQNLPLSGTGSGTGSIILSLSPFSLDFGSVMVGTTSSPQVVTVTNTGTVAASFLYPFGFAIQGTDPGDFGEQPSCSTSLAPNKSCTVALTFTPKTSGARTGSLVVRQGAATVQIPVNGTGTP
jgi:hypothetical protein